MFSSPYSEEMYYRTDRLLLTATGSLKPVHRAPSVASVITAAEIEKLGATTLDEVLETIPGLHVSPSTVVAGTPVYSIRGILTALNPHVLLLINGVRTNVAYYGGRPSFLRIPVTAISRIEVIRGPGSALHGADAFAGTVNVITKDGQEIDGTHAGARYGSFDSFDTWLQHGGTYDGWDVSLTLDYQKSDGDKDRVIDTDLQTLFDPNVSLAPGPLGTNYEIANIHLGLIRDDWTFRLWGWEKNNSGGYAGATQVLAPGNNLNSRQLITELEYSNKDLLNRDLEINGRLSFLYGYEDAFTELFPAGAILPIGTDGNLFSAVPWRPMIFSDGVFGNPQKTDKHYAIDLFGNYQGIASHALRLGTGLQFFEEDTDEYKNFGPGTPLEGLVLPAFSVVDGTLTHVSPADAYMSKQDRHLWYVSLQDEWAFAKNWELTAGVRYDRYSDFGNTINPRLALVWEARYDLVTKLLYGQAFRPPSFNDLYTQNNPINRGNKSLDPETIKVLELVFDYQPTANLHTVLNLYQYKINDLIDLVADDPAGSMKTAQNAKDQEGRGFELEAQWDITDTLRLQGNFALQRSRDSLTKALVSDAPTKQVSANLQWNFLPDWYATGLVTWVSDRKRAVGDARKEIDDYTKTDLVLRRKNIAHYWEVAVAARNLFNEDIREPSASAIHNDFPMEGRSIWGELRFSY